MHCRTHSDHRRPQAEQGKTACQQNESNISHEVLESSIRATRQPGFRPAQRQASQPAVPIGALVAGFVTRSYARASDRDLAPTHLGPRSAARLVACLPVRSARGGNAGLGRGLPEWKVETSWLMVVSSLTVAVFALLGLAVRAVVGCECRQCDWLVLAVALRFHGGRPLKPEVSR